MLNCPDGYEVIGNEWFGTVEGNKTDDGVEKTGQDWKGQIPPNPSVLQPLVIHGEQGMICGKRISTGTNYLNATLTSNNISTSCAKGLQACSHIDDLPGQTFCVADKKDCPVTDLAILAKNSKSAKLTDPAYTQVPSPSGGGYYSQFSMFYAGLKISAIRLFRLTKGAYLSYFR